MTKYEQLQQQLKSASRRWLVTGCAGFIGSNLLESLLQLDQTVIGLDNFSTGKPSNLDQVQALVTPAQWNRFHFIKGDICDLDTCRRAVELSGTDELSVISDQLSGRLKTSAAGAAPIIHEPITDNSNAAATALTQSDRTPGTPAPCIDFVLHQAALGSVPRSIEDPIRTNASNITGFLNLLVAARDAGVKRFVYAASSSTYGDHPGLPKLEDVIGKPLSPYAVTKYVNELYADVFARCYGVETVGLRYFNVFGPRQDPDGAYAAVIPKWIAAMLRDEPIYINGDGETSRDFCYVANAVQANLLAATTDNPAAINQIYNVAVGDRTTLNDLFEHLRSRVAALVIDNRSPITPHHRPFRPGDVAHSQADISKARRLLEYAPSHRIADGLEEAFPWYIRHNAPQPRSSFAPVAP